eukprot:3144142-Prymnesium_polylepis.3
MPERSCRYSSTNPTMQTDVIVFILSNAARQRVGSGYGGSVANAHAAEASPPDALPTRYAT